VASLEFNKEHAHCFFCHEGLCSPWLFVPPNTTVNSWLLLWRFETLERKRVTKIPELWHNHNWLLHHDVPAHTSLKTTQFVTKNNMVIVPHPPYLPDCGQHSGNIRVHVWQDKTRVTTVSQTWNSSLSK
jgi:hypothetical protein